MKGEDIRSIFEDIKSIFADVKSIFEGRDRYLNKHETSGNQKEKQPFADILQNFAKFTGKHLCWSLFLVKLQVFIKFYKGIALEEEKDI